ncbi:MAG: T9SS type A sorting domain-containing protein [Candidatus Eisenbacteria bacterium]|nr:T9SS type A sorting domain-containing protein [Candidatus Eisenbacteria bacterium]
MRCLRNAAPRIGAVLSGLLFLLVSVSSSLAWVSGRSPAASRASASDDGYWYQLPPPALNQHGAIFDPVRQRMLVFGGTSMSPTNDVWEFGLAGSPAWSLLAVTGTRPAARWGPSTIYDPALDRLVVFAGASDSTTSYNDVWVLPLGVLPLAWQQLAPAGGLPAARVYQSAVYDSLRNRLIVHGGAQVPGANGPPTGLLSDVWELTLGVTPTWTELLPTGVSPDSIAGQMTIVDPARDRMVVYGGYNGVMLGDVWQMTLGASPAWTLLAPSGGPPPARAVGVTVYDRANDRMVISTGISDPATGGNLNDVWALDLAAPAWTELVPLGTPPATRGDASGIFDAPRQRMVLYGGQDTMGTAPPDLVMALALGDTVRWSELGTRRPEPRNQHAGIYDPPRNRLVIYGGMTGASVLGDTWALALGGSPTWSDLAPTGSLPGIRWGHRLLYDPVRARMLLYGGSDSVSSPSGVWALALAGAPVWSQLAPAGPVPPSRMECSMVYDATRDRMLVFGGWGGPGNDGWALDLSGSPTWSEIVPLGTPPGPRAKSAAIYDPINDRMLIFGGDNSGPLDELWELALSGTPPWTQLAPTGTLPTPRRGAVAAYDSLGHRMLVYGGDTGGYSGTSDTYALELNGAPVWKLLAVGTTVPPGRFDLAGGFDLERYRLVINDGCCWRMDDSWVLQLDRTTAALASLVSARAEPDRVELAWYVSVPGGEANVYRREEGGDWAVLGRAGVDGSGMLRFVDRDVVAGRRYGYRLGVSGGSGETPAGEVWVDVPATLALALRGFRPNPAPGEALVAFSLPGASPAWLEVMDVGGRRVFRREVGTLGAGNHLVRLSGAAVMPAGMYVVRLTQGGRAVSAKAALVR